MITVSSNIGDFAKNLKSEITSNLDAQMVDELVKQARADGESTVDYINLTVTGERGGVRIDKGRVKRLANQLLAGAAPLIGQPQSLTGETTTLVAGSSDEKLV